MDKNKSVIITIIVLVIAALTVLTGIFKLKPATTPTTSQSQLPQGQKTIALTEQDVITVTKNGFEPATLTTKVNMRVIWINKSGGKVTVNSDDHPTHLKFPLLNFGEFADGTSVQTKFDKPGTYTYHNHYQPTQKGTIIVK